MNAPVTYKAGWISPAIGAHIYNTLWEELAWVRHDKVPRREYYCPELSRQLPYTYGKGAGVRTYEPQPMHPLISQVWVMAEDAAGCKFDVCFLNGYEDQSDHLGWHADDSPEMDDSRPIAIVSLGAEREIWFRPKPDDALAGGVTKRELFGNPPPAHDALLLQHGSLCLMAPGMQDTHQHRIPKAGRIAGERISFTFRGFDRTVTG